MARHTLSAPKRKPTSTGQPAQQKTSVPAAAPNAILQMQKLYGNQKVQQMLAIQMQRDPQQPIQRTSWKSSKLSQIWKSKKKKMAPEMETLHHKVPRDLLTFFWELLNAKQKGDLKSAIGMGPEGIKALWSFTPNLTAGPLPEKRSDDPKNNFDGNYVEEPVTRARRNSVRSGILVQVYSKLVDLEKNHDRRYYLGQTEFEAIVDLLKQALEEHVKIVGSKSLDTDTSMWAESGGTYAKT